jgi:hypothetical protein
VFAVLLGLGALAVGPLLGPLLQRHTWLAAAVDAFVVVTVTGLVVLHVLPQSVALTGPAALVVAAFGLVVPALLHRFDAAQRPAAWRGSRDVLALAVLLAAAFGHALLDGVALVDGGHAGGHDGPDGPDGPDAHHDDGVPGGHALHEHGDGLSALALAVLLHRLPYGLALWVVGRERLGRARSIAVLLSLAAGTIVGAVVGDQLVSAATAGIFAGVQAFAAGAILHVLLEAPTLDVRGARRSSVVGVGLGVGVLLLLTQTHPVIAVVVDELPFATVLRVLATSTVPAALLAVVVVTIRVLVGRRRPGRHTVVRGGTALRQALFAVAAAAGVGLCGCRVGSALESLLRRRAGVASGVAFLVAAPQLEPAGLFLSWQLLGPVFTGLRVIVAVLVAIVVGVVVAAVAGTTTAPGNTAVPATPGEVAVDVGDDSAAQVVRSLVDHGAPWLLLGLVGAAFLEPLVAPASLAWIAALPAPLGVVAFAAAAVPVYLCAPAALPIAAVLLHKGVPAGAVLAFLVVGPAASVTTLSLLARHFTPRAAVAFAVAGLAALVAVVVVVVAVVVDVAGAGALTWGATALHTSSATSTLFASGVVMLGLGALGWSLVRQGARGFLGQIIHPLDDARGGHVHGPHCGHREHARSGFGRKAPVARVRIDFPVDTPRG